MYKIINRKKLAATFAADLLGNILFFPRVLWRLALGNGGKISPNSVRSILLVRTAYMGDVVMTLPLLKPLRTRFPRARISFLTASNAKDVLINNPYIDEIITYDPFWFYPSPKREYRDFLRKLRKRSYDIVIEARGDIREIMGIVYPAKARYRAGFGFGGGSFLLTHVVPYTGIKHKLEYHLDIAKYLGCRVEGIEWGIYLRDEEKKRVQELLNQYGVQQQFIAVHPGARHALRRWFIDRYAQLYDQVAERFGMQIVMVGSPGEIELAESIIRLMRTRPANLVGQANLRELAGILKRANLFICNNTGPMHIAASMKTPTVVLHGPSKTYWDAPYGNVHRIVEKEFTCRKDCDENSCRSDRHHACMHDIEVDDVFSAVNDILKELNRS